MSMLSVDEIGDRNLMPEYDEESGWSATAFAVHAAARGAFWAQCGGIDTGESVSRERAGFQVAGG